MMRVFILADPNSIHTRRWITSLSGYGIDLFLFGVNKHDPSFYNDLRNVEVYSEDISSGFKGTSVGKIRYLSVLKTLKTKILQFKPDLLHSHYASSYGLLGALVNFHPFVISVWGSDVYEFPGISLVHRSILRYVLSKADIILSTSESMAAETRKYTKKTIEITPFGVDSSLFVKDKVPKKETAIRIGTVKTLDKIYGIDTLIRSFSIVLAANKGKNIILEIVGDGPDKEKLVSLARNLGIDGKVLFTGRKENSSLPAIYNNFTIFAALSNSESFGVVAIEAMACQCPLVVSDADGFAEVVTDGYTGFIVPRKNADAAASALQKFIDNPELRKKFGTRGRAEVLKKYDWGKNVELMVSIYKRISTTNQ